MGSQGGSGWWSDLMNGHLISTSKGYTLGQLNLVLTLPRTAVRDMTAWKQTCCMRIKIIQIHGSLCMLL